MGFTLHSAVIITSFQEDAANKAHAMALRCGCQATEIATSVVNSHCTFVVLPHGSKAGWAEAEAGDASRAAFVGWLDKQRFDDSSSVFEWVEVEYSSDLYGYGHKRGARLVQTVWDGRRAEESAG